MSQTREGGREEGRKRRDIAVIVEQMKGKREGHSCRKQRKEERGSEERKGGSVREGHSCRSKTSEGREDEGRDIAVGLRQRIGGGVGT